MSKNNFSTVKHLFFIYFYLNIELNSLQIHRDTFSKISILFRICQKTVFYYEHGICAFLSPIVIIELLVM